MSSEPKMKLCPICAAQLRDPSAAVVPTGWHVCLNHACECVSERHYELLDPEVRR